MRIAQLSPDAKSLDVDVDSTKVLANAAYTTVKPYTAVAAGAHTLVIRRAGTPATSTPLAHKAITVTAGRDYTAAILGLVAHLSPSFFADENAVPAGGRATVRLLHAAPAVPTVDVNNAKSGARVFTGVSYGHPTKYAPITGGSYDFSMAKTGTDQLLWTVKGVAVKAGSAYTLAAVGGAGRPLQVLPLVDAGGAGNAPAGGVQTGLGGTALHHDAIEAWLFGVLAIACATGSLVIWRRRSA